MAAALVGADAAICAIGPASNGKPGTLISDGTRNILAGCAKEHVRRLVFESGVMVSEQGAVPLRSHRHLGVRTIYPKLYADKVIAENAIKKASYRTAIAPRCW